MGATADLARLELAGVAWIAADPDPATRAELSAALDRADVAELADLLDRRLEFGTAGLRGPLGPGPNRMNRVVVAQAAAGLARQMRGASAASTEMVAVVGRDARHGSEDFASEIVDVLVAHGIDVHLFVTPVPTPLVAFAARHLDADAAVVVTASHNPATDNGMKIYWSDAAQIVSPVDEQIAEQIDAVRHDGAIRPLEVERRGRIISHRGADSDDPVVTAYITAASGLSTAPPSGVTVAATSLHGVGAALLERLLSIDSRHRLHVVAEQRDPDPEFPTVEFPNPEEPGALDLVIELAERVDADLVVANDPDADRLALAARTRSGSWRALTGDETGALFAAHLLGTGVWPDRLVATTVVSSRLLEKIAADAGVHFAETLTGFKWLCRPGLEQPRLRQVLLYEEALGYAIGEDVRDKDGLTAALVAVEMVAGLRDAGRTVWDVLDELAERHGAHVARNGSVRLGGAGWQRRRDRLMDSLVDEPPASLGSIAVNTVDRPAGDVIRLNLADATRVVIRPSGTEPKLKYYCEAIEEVHSAEAGLSDRVARARESASARLDAIINELSEQFLTTE